MKKSDEYTALQFLRDLLAITLMLTSMLILMACLIGIGTYGKHPHAAMMITAGVACAFSLTILAGLLKPSFF